MDHRQVTTCSNIGVTANMYVTHFAPNQLAQLGTFALGLVHIINMQFWM